MALRDVLPDSRFSYFLLQTHVVTEPGEGPAVVSLTVEDLSSGEKRVFASVVDFSRFLTRLMEPASDERPREELRRPGRRGGEQRSGGRQGRGEDQSPSRLPYRCGNDDDRQGLAHGAEFRRRERCDDAPGKRAPRDEAKRPAGNYHGLRPMAA